MSSLLVLTVYKVIVLIVGLIISYWGYKLFIKGISFYAGDVDARTESTEMSLAISIKKAAPGTFFCLLGAVIICISLFKGIDIDSQTIFAENTASETQEENPQSSSSYTQESNKEVESNVPLPQKQKANKKVSPSKEANQLRQISDLIPDYKQILRIDKLPLDKDSDQRLKELLKDKFKPQIIKAQYERIRVWIPSTFEPRCMGIYPTRETML